MKTLFGNEMQEDRVFLVKPGFIGEITHAFSSLTTKSNSFTQPQRRLIRVGIITSFIIIGWLAVKFLHIPSGTKVIVAVGCGLMGVFISIFITPSKYHHVFVGTEGIAEYFIDPETRDAKGLQNLRFKDPSFLLKEIVENFNKGIYQNTSYKFEWYNSEGEPIYEAKSIFRRSETENSIENLETYYTSPRYNYLLKGELSWTSFLRKKLEKEDVLKNKGQYEFIVVDYRGDHLGFHYLRPNEFSIQNGKENIVFARGELKELNIDKGILEFIPSDALTQKGMNPIRCDLSRIGNAQLFLELAGQWLKTNS